MHTIQTILESLRDGIGADLTRFVSGDQEPDVDSKNAEINAEDVFNILARAKMRQAEGLPASAE
ncbi:MAG: hypothetical protein WBX25_16575 [Rhodomicrobium sp.]